jgi:D-alanyl-D-alanine dipeptidase
MASKKSAASFFRALPLLCGILLVTVSPYGQPVKDCPDTAEIERQMKNRGLVNVRALDTTIIYNLKYSGIDNYMYQDMYNGLCNCYLTKEAAQKLVAAQKLLRKKRPQFSIVALDCARPRSVQRKMWEHVKGKPEQKYVAAPGAGSVHNYGCAVDATIADSSGAEIDMGTPFDFFGDLAQPRYEEKFLKEGKLSLSQIENRKLLREVMRGAGFLSINTEWWHFNAFPKNEVKARFSVVE